MNLSRLFGREINKADLDYHLDGETDLFSIAIGWAIAKGMHTSEAIAFAKEIISMSPRITALLTRMNLESRQWIIDHLSEINMEEDFDQDGNLINADFINKSWNQNENLTRTNPAPN